MFISTEFKTAWEEWKTHKSEKHGMPYTSVSERKALSALFQRCNGREDWAIASIDYSIECNWANIYIKKPENGQQSTDKQKSSLRGGVQAEFDKRYGGR